MTTRYVTFFVIVVSAVAVVVTSLQLSFSPLLPRLPFALVHRPNILPTITRRRISSIMGGDDEVSRLESKQLEHNPNQQPQQQKQQHLNQIVTNQGRPTANQSFLLSTIISDHVRAASIAQSLEDASTQQYEMENAERTLVAWVGQYRHSRRGVTAMPSSITSTATTPIIHEERAERMSVERGLELSTAGGVVVPAPDANIFDMVIGGLLALPLSLVPGIVTVADSEAVDDVDDDIDDIVSISATNERSTLSKSDRATAILDLMETFHEPPGPLTDTVIASHAKDALEYLACLSMERHREVKRRKHHRHRQRSKLIIGDEADEDDVMTVLDKDAESRFSSRSNFQRMAWKSAKSALLLLNRSEELYYETGQLSSRLPGISSYIVVMDVWKALVVSGVNYVNDEIDNDGEELEGGEDMMKRKRDEALEVVKNLRQRRLRVYDPRANENDDKNRMGIVGGRSPFDGSKSSGGYNVLPPSEVVASMMTVNDVLDFGVNLLRESVPSYQLPRRNDEEQTARVGTWHFNQLIFDLAKYPQPYSGPLAQDLLDYMMYTVRKQHRKRKRSGSKKKVEIQSDATAQPQLNIIVPKPNSATINGVLKAWMVTPPTHYPDAARRAEAVLAKLAIWQSEGVIWGVNADTVSYNTCINMWKKSVDIPGAAQRATDILLLMEDESTSVTPDDISYATCIGAWADCSSHVTGAGRCAEEILMRMYNRSKNAMGNDSVAPKPTARCFNAVLLAYANGRQSGNGKRALELLRFMERLHSEGYTLSPDKFTFNIVMKALASCGERGAAHKANQLLQRMEASHAKGDSSLKPDLLSYNTVLDAFSKEGDAKSAERLLEQMLRKGDEMLKPNAYSYTAVLTSLSKSEDKAVAVSRAEEIFNDIESKYAAGETDFHADTSVYNALINCWAKSSERKAIYRVTQILALMEELGLQGGDSDVQPNSRTYCAVLDTLARSKSQKACSMSLEILQRMHDFHAEGYDSVRPCVRAYSIVLSIIARSRRKDKAVKAQEILHQMESEHRNGNASCRPNVYSYNAVLNAAAFSGRDEREQEDAFRVACSTFDELRMSDYLVPSDISYGTFLKAIKHLMPESEVRDNLVKGVFRKCCRDGLASDFVLKEMSDLATPEMYQSLLKGVTNDYGNLPKTWSVNVGMFGKAGKAFADQIADQIEKALGDHLASKTPQSTERATEKLGSVTGRRRALFIGINYFGQKGELRGCINDVQNIKRFLTSNFRVDEFLVLTDDQKDPKCIPTRQNILSAFRWLREGAKAGDSLILHYSGHGGSVKDKDGDEEDGMDETLIPVDYEKSGYILDDEVHNVLVRGLPKGVRLTAIMDCCHSESILDLPFLYTVDGNLQIIETSKNEGIVTLVGAGTRFLLDGNKKRAVSSITQGMKMLMQGDKGGNSEAREKAVKTRSTEADVIQFSGCKDHQTSADAHIDGKATGAMSYALITSLSKNKNQDYTHLLQSMRQILTGKYTQVPMMSAGRKLVLDHPFSI